MKQVTNSRAKQRETAVANVLSRESEFLMRALNPSSESEFWGTIDQLIGWNVAQLRARANLSQSDVATLFERFTGRVHSRNWLSLRETGRQPFTVAEVLLLADLFRVSVLRLFQLPIGKDDGMVFVDGMSKPARRLIDNFVTSSEDATSDFADIANEGEEHGEQDVGKLMEHTPSVPALLAHGANLKVWIAYLRDTRDEWLPQVAERNRKSRDWFREWAEPHPGAGKRYTAWKRRRREHQEETEELIRQAIRRRRDGNDQED
jgi:transcriptional regulator with XRE-family HTH domain